MEVKRYKSLQALRICCFFSIFLNHFYGDTFYTSLSLSIFFVLSGFLLSIKYSNNSEDVTFKKSVIFAIKRVKKIYFLHIITMVADIFLYIGMYKYNGISSKDLIKFVFNIFANILLIQSWIPDVDINVSLNGVAWFLSVLFYIYLLFPYLNSKLKNRNNVFYYHMLVLMVMIKSLTVYVASSFFGDATYVCSWISSLNVFGRLPDFLMGYFLGQIYLNKKEFKISFLYASVIEILLTIFSFYSIKHYFPFMSSKYELSGWCDISLQLLVSFLWVLMFFINNGIITKLLSNNLFAKMGDYSGYAYLIHYPIIQWFYYLIGTGRLAYFVHRPRKMLLTEILLTVVLSFAYGQLYKITAKGR